MKFLIPVIAAIALAAVVPTTASAYVPIKRCAWWNLEAGDELVIDQAYTTCSRARDLGNAYLAESGWRPRYLWAAGRRWRLTEYEYNREWGYRSLAYMSRTRSGGRLQVLLTYQWEV